MRRKILSIFFGIGSVATVIYFLLLSISMTCYKHQYLARPGEKRHDNVCTPKRNIMFLKTPKCASSTVQNILMRYGDNMNLTFVLPAKGNLFGQRVITTFDASQAIPLPSAYSKEYNIFCHHTRWNEANISEILPANTVYITILRDPATMFESLYSYLNLKKFYSVSLSKFIEAPWLYHKLPFKDSVVRNRASYIFGLEVEQFDEQEAIDRLIFQTQRKFSLVMLTEFMDESLVLLREILCWSWNDMVALKVNVRTRRVKQNLTEQVSESIRNWNLADTQLYRHFRQRLIDQITVYGLENMRRDVLLIRVLSRFWYKYCVKGGTLTNIYDERFRASVDNVLGYKLSDQGFRNNTCIQLALTENAFTEVLKEKLWPDWTPITATLNR